MEERQIATVRGNHDRWALERGPGGAIRHSFRGGTPSSRTPAATPSESPFHLAWAPVGEESIAACLWYGSGRGPIWSS